MSGPVFPGPGLAPAQWEHAQALARSITPNQAIWLSGYFAGLEEARRGPADGLAPSPQAVGGAPEALDAPAEGRTLTILYGSETGNSRDVAETLAEAAGAAGRAATVADMADYKLRKLKDEQDLLVVVSTYGEGDPPQGAVDFFEFLEGRKAPRLPDLRFSVLALGDSTYERYCEAGKRVDRRLEELGARRIHPRIDCDVDYEDLAESWTKEVVAELAGEKGERAAAARPVNGANAVLGAAAFDKKNPFHATVIDNLVLTGRGSSKETRHIELSLEGSGLTYQPGDALGVVARNDPKQVEALLETLGISPEAEVETRGGRVALAEALEGGFEIGVAAPRFLERWAEIADAKALRRLADPQNAAERTAFLRDNHVIDIVRAFPAKGVAPDAFVAGLRPLQPRLYSIASSLAAAPDEAHLTVATVRYALNGLARTGVASGHLASRAEPDGTLPVYVQANPHFRLPKDDAPIVMIGAGTGVAPYRAFLQEREAREASGKAWLFFGERNFRSDFLYQTEWQAWLKDGLLARMDVAFSRDRAEKLYVQHRLLEKAKDLFAWLEEGAHVYVCGDAAHLAPDVHEALTTAVQQQGGLGREAAGEYLRALQRDDRYQRDVY
jgi:sulfite reductase (NADPH) flavoprotein alpha-component